MASFNLNDYETVDHRIKRFYKDYPPGRIITELLDVSGDIGASRWIVKALVYKNHDPGREPDATGMAFEVDGSGMANKTAALENGETSAIGRALANLGYSGDKRASREEMKKASRTSPQTLQAAREAKDVSELNNIFKESVEQGYATAELRAALNERKAELQEH